MKFSDKDIYENFQIVKNLPLVHKLMKKIEKLERKNKELKQVVKILTKVECPKPKLEKSSKIYDGVEIKQELYDDDDVIEIIEEPNIEFKVIDLEEKEYVKCSECDNTFIKGGYEKRHGLCYECYSKREIKNIVTENIVEEHESIAEEAESDEYEEVEEEGVNGGNSPVEEAESDEYEEVEEDEEGEEEEEGGNGGMSPIEGVNGGDSPVEEDSSVEEDEEVIEVTIKGKTYYTTDEQNGIIYDVDENGDISIEVGKYKNGKPIIKKNS